MTTEDSGAVVDVGPDTGSSADSGSKPDAGAPFDTGAPSDAGSGDDGGSTADGGFVDPCPGCACTQCMQEKCADLLAYCSGVGECACMANCMGANGVVGVPGCLDRCGAMTRPLSFAALEECVGVACPDVDECSTPAGWMPEPSVPCPGSALPIGGGAVANCGFDKGLPHDPLGAVLQLESVNGDVCVRLERRDDGAGSLANTSWTSLEVRVGPLGEVAIVDQPSDQCWYSSHHNFRDWVHVWTGTRRFDIAVKLDGWGGARRYVLYAFEQGPIDPMTCAPEADGDQCIAGPIELFPVNP